MKLPNKFLLLGIMAFGEGRIMAQETCNDLMKILDHRDAQERSAAVLKMKDSCTAENISAVEKKFSQHRDHYVREHLALLLGTIGNAATRNVVQRILSQEKDEHAKRAMILALVKLGDDGQGELFKKRLTNPDPFQRVQALEDLKYLKDKNLLSEAVTLLDDKTEAKNVAPSHGRLMIRICDIAIEVFDETLAHPFDFNVERVKRYSDKELKAAAGTLKKKLSL